MYVFSTENWVRPKDEIDGILNILRKYLDEMDKYIKENIKVKFLGDISVFDDDIITKMKRAEDISKDNTGLTLNLAINYGGRSEITMATKKLAKMVLNGEIAIEDINEDVLSNSLYTSGMPDVDLIIRPSGEYRLSNFLIWQSAYAEYVFMDNILWPDFKEKDLDKAIEEYNRRNRRFGGV